MNALQQQELENIELDAIEEEIGFRINNLESANWALRKIAAMNAKIAEAEALAQKEIDRINAWKQAEIDKLEPQVKLFESWLVDYHMRELEKNPKAKTITTPYGKLKSTTRSAAPKTQDEEALLAYLKQNAGEYVKVVEKPMWAEFKRTLSIVQDGDEAFVIDEAGYKVPGVSVEVGSTTFKVEVSE